MRTRIGSRNEENPGRMPPDVLAALGLPPGERVLAAATGRDGRWYAGTALALYVPAYDSHKASEANPTTAYRRLPWERVSSADWQRDGARLTLLEVPEDGEPERATVVEVDRSGRLPEMVHERVMKSLVWTAQASVGARGQVTVAARRSPSGNGPVTWSVTAPGLDATDPAVRAAIDRLLSEGEHELAGL